MHHRLGSDDDDQTALGCCTLAKLLEELESIQSSQSADGGAEFDRKRQEVERWIPESSLPSTSSTTTKLSSQPTNGFPTKNRTAPIGTQVHGVEGMTG